jgi:hypothetical protein
VQTAGGAHTGENAIAGIAQNVILGHSNVISNQFSVLTKEEQACAASESLKRNPRRRGQALHSVPEWKSIADIGEQDGGEREVQQRGTQRINEVLRN